MTDLSNVTRVEVIDGFGRSYQSFNAENVYIKLQDDGRTLKIFHDGDTSHRMIDHARSLGEATASDRAELGEWISGDPID